MSDQSRPEWSPSNFVTLTAEAQRRASAPSRPEFDAVVRRLDESEQDRARTHRIEERLTRTAEDVASVLTQQQALMERLADQRREVSEEIDTKIDGMRDEIDERLSPTESDVRVLMGIKERVWWLLGGIAGVWSAAAAVGWERVAKLAARIIA